jgi:hypothetical protein
MNFATGAEKIDFDSTNLYLFEPTCIASLMEKSSQEDEVRSLFHLDAVREEPELPFTDKIVVHLGACEVQILANISRTCHQAH